MCPSAHKCANPLNRLSPSNKCARHFTVHLPGTSLFICLALHWPFNHQIRIFSAFEFSFPCGSAREEGFHFHLIDYHQCHFFGFLNPHFHFLWCSQQHHYPSPGCHLIEKGFHFHLAQFQCKCGWQYRSLWKVLETSWQLTSSQPREGYHNQ